MTVRELIEELEEFDEDMEVVFKPSNSHYVDSVGYLKEKEISSFYGSDRKAVVLVSDGQTGAV